MLYSMKRFGAMLAVVLLAAGTGQASAAESDGWNFDLNVYVWLAAIKGTTSGGGDVDIPFSDIVSNLDFTMMLGGEAHKGKWSILSDLIYMDINAKENLSGNVFDPPVVAEGKVNVSMKSWVINLAGGYTVVDMEKIKLDLIGGARYLYIKPGLSASVGNASRSFSDSGDVVDGIIGVRGKTPLSEKWYLTYYLDAGTGDTDSTWQAAGGVGYHFQSLDAFAGYRYLKWNFDSNDTGGKLYNDLDISGPYLGVKFLF